MQAWQFVAIVVVLSIAFGVGVNGHAFGVEEGILIGWEDGYYEGFYDGYYAGYDDAINDTLEIIDESTEVNNT